MRNLETVDTIVFVFCPFGCIFHFSLSYHRHRRQMATATERNTKHPYENCATAYNTPAEEKHKNRTPTTKQNKYKYKFHSVSEIDARLKSIHSSSCRYFVFQWLWCMQLIRAHIRNVSCCAWVRKIKRRDVYIEARTIIKIKSSCALFVVAYVIFLKKRAHQRQWAQVQKNGIKWSKTGRP